MHIATEVYLKFANLSIRKFSNKSVNMVNVCEWYYGNTEQCWQLTAELE